ncbi:MAG: kinase/pyrophosphorylase [Deltaproteobacteria bacterium]|nr:kinase/pyrophosphorylase [Deltaproteobacteria bacterium]
MPLDTAGRPQVLIVSDSLGETAELVTRAALSQFTAQLGDGAVEVRRFPMVTNPSDIEGIVREARVRPTLIVYTLIVPEAQEAMTQQAEAHGIVAVDIMGPMISGFTQVLGVAPRLQPGLIHQMDAGYFKRVESVEFAVKYDDARDPRGFLLADVVLVGLSRCSKTPVSMYLAHRNHKVANLPLVPELSLPKEIFDVPRWKMVGLRVDAMHLSRIRAERVRAMGAGSGVARSENYADLARILTEIEYAESVFKRLGCPVIDVTSKAVEETAVRVLDYVQTGRRMLGLADPAGGP